MSNELEDIARCLFNGQLPSGWRRLAPDTLKNLGNWMLHFASRLDQYSKWVSGKYGPLILQVLLNQHHSKTATILRSEEYRVVPIRRTPGYTIMLYILL